MAPIAVRAEDLGKKYFIGEGRPGAATTLRDTLADPARFFRRERPMAQEFWALSHVSFAVERGECLGIVGRNGAGKSTLLKILSRITEPTTGRVALKGRVASLLEVGTGFHPELTGRENIFLNGAILGMKRAEILRRFDEIVAFSEVEQFLDTPVKRYSSGMYMRLAFAIAAHLEPEVLMIDEVLAVGDVHFQRKCLGKMGDVAREGRTVLFVSHNLTALVALCRRGLLLDEGRIVAEGEIASVVSQHVSRLLDQRRGAPAADAPAYGFRRVSLRNIALNPPREVEAADGSGSYVLEFQCRLPPSPGVNVGFTLLNDAEVPALSGSARDGLAEIPSGDVQFSVSLPVSRLPSGRYRVEGAVWDGSERYDQSDALLVFDVVNPRSSLDVVGFKPRGATLVDTPWTVSVTARDAAAR